MKGVVEINLNRLKYQLSPIPKGGLEIVLRVTFTIEEDKGRYIKRLQELIQENYEIPQENVTGVLDGNNVESIEEQEVEGEQSDDDCLCGDFQVLFIDDEAEEVDDEGGAEADDIHLYVNVY